MKNDPVQEVLVEAMGTCAATAIFGFIGPGVKESRNIRIVQCMSEWFARFRSTRACLASDAYARIGWFPEVDAAPLDRAVLGTSFQVVHGREHLTDGVRLIWGRDADHRKLELWRTGHGAIPLFWSCLGENIVFCSSDAALISAVGGPVDVGYVLDSIIQEYSVHGSFSTIVRPVQAGGGICIDIQNDIIHCEELTGGPHGGISSSEEMHSAKRCATEEIYSSLLAACERCVPKTGPVHLLLSDGIDSNLLAVIIRQELGREVIGHRFLDAGEDLEKDPELLNHYDRKRIDVVVHRFADESIWDASAESAEIHMGILPFLHGGVRLLLMRELARITDHVITGEGSDEHFFGYPYYQRCAEESDTSSDTNPDLMRWNCSAQTPTTNPRQPLIDVMLRRLTNVLSRSADHHVVSRHHASYAQGEMLVAMQAEIDCSRILSNYSLRFLGNQLDQAAGVFSSCPFLEQDVVVSALKCPPSSHLFDGRGKYLLRKLIEDKNLLPLDLIRRPKRAFIRGVRNEFPWSSYPCVQRFMSPEAIRSTGFFNEVAITDLIHRVKGGNSDVYDQLLLIAIWHAQMLLQRVSR